MERRKAKRFKDGEIYIALRTGSILSKKQTPLISVDDISEKGLSFIYSKVLPFGKKLLISLYLPAYNKPVIVKAGVRKSQKLPNGQYKIGLEFIKISPQIKKNFGYASILPTRPSDKKY